MFDLIKTVALIMLVLGVLAAVVSLISVGVHTWEELV